MPTLYAWAPSGTRADDIKPAQRGTQSIDTLFLPPYSPELNPIEESWAVIKAWLKRKKARNIGDYIDGLLDAKENIDEAIGEAFFKHAASFETFC